MMLKLGNNQIIPVYLTHESIRSLFQYRENSGVIVVNMNSLLENTSKFSQLSVFRRAPWSNNDITPLEP